MDLVISILAILTIYGIKIVFIKDTSNSVVTTSSAKTASVATANKVVQPKVNLADIPVGNNYEMNVVPNAFELIPRQLGLLS